MIRILILFAGLVFLPSLLLAQKPGGGKPGLSQRDSMVIKLFDQPVQLQWLKNFKGRLDDIVLADISLGFDGTNCRGWIFYTKSRTRFRLIGTLQGDKLQLEERDEAGKNATARLLGTLKAQHLVLEWVNTPGTLGSQLVADELLAGQTMNLTCGDNKWACRYIGKYSSARSDMVLMRMHNSDLQGYLWVEADNKTYTLRGTVSDDNKYQLEALLDNGKVAGQLEGTIKVGVSTDFVWVGSGEKRNFSLTQRDKYVMGCFEYADYLSQYDALFPRTPNATCNTWLDQQISNWVARCRATLTAKKDPLEPGNRSKYRAGCWADVVCWTDNIFAGYLIFSDTWNNDAQGASFNFDLKSGKNITYDDLFNKGFNAKTWFEDYAKKESPKMPEFASDPVYREWLAISGFPQFAIRREGIELSTYFHPRYGRQSLVVPYSTLKPYMKKDNPIAEFVK